MKNADQRGVLFRNANLRESTRTYLVVFFFNQCGSALISVLTFLFWIRVNSWFPREKNGESHK